MAQLKNSPSLEVATRLKVESENWVGYNPKTINQAYDTIISQEQQIQYDNKQSKDMRLRIASYFAWAFTFVGMALAITFAIVVFGTNPSSQREYDLKMSYQYLTRNGYLTRIYDNSASITKGSSTSALILYRWEGDSPDK